MKLNKYKVAGTLSIILLIITPWLNQLVNIMFRGNVHDRAGFGSECLLWLFPIMIVGLVDAILGEKHNI
ncbi:MAG: hypothetical protein ACK5LC_12200 [Coprobacillaceae bacterium]